MIQVSPFVWKSTAASPQIISPRSPPLAPTPLSPVQPFTAPPATPRPLPPCAPNWPGLEYRGFKACQNPLNCHANSGRNHERAQALFDISCFSLLAMAPIAVVARVWRDLLGN